MTHRIIAAALFVTALGAIGLGYYLFHFSPSQEVQYGVGLPILISIRWLPPLFLVLTLVRKEVFATWVRVFVPVALILFLATAFTPVSNGTWIELGPDRTYMAVFSVTVLYIISAFVIAWKYWRLRRKPAAQ